MSGGGGKQTVGYWYKLGWQMVLCQGGADAITKIEYADREAWSGNVTSNQTITINKLDLLGGEKREGGLAGDVDFMFGAADQPVNSYLAYHANRPIVSSYSEYAELGGIAAFVHDMIADGVSNPNDKVVPDGGIPVPAYRGLVSLVFKAFTYAAMNPYMKEMSVTVRRVPKSLSTSYATIIIDGRYNANGSHIIYEVLTTKVWGLGFDPGDGVNIASFMAAAQTLYNENFGISIAWTDEGTAESFIDLIRQHINAVVYPAPDTGQYTIKLIRDDYDADAAMWFDASNCNVRSFQRTATTDLVNEVTIQYRDPKQDKEAKVTVQNLAAIRMVGRVIRRVISLPGIRDGNLAARVAVRELQTLSTPLAKVALDANMEAWNVRPGDVFNFAWPKLGIERIIMRVVEVEYGELRSGRISITAVEDQFGLPDSTYITPVVPAWVELPVGLSDITAYKLAEVPYFAIIRAQGEDYASNLADNRNFVYALASRSNGLWTGFEMHENIGGTYTFVASGVFSPWVGLASAVSRLPTDNVWSYDTFYEDDEVAVGDIGVVDSEWVQVTAIDTALKLVTVERGVLDTIPATHASGARLWLFFDEYAQDYSTERLAGETVTYKLLPVSGSDTLPVGGATAHSVSITGRQQRPYPPGNVKLNTVYFPTTVVDDVIVTWTHRDRTIQTADPIPWSSASVTLEAGVTYTAQVYRNTDNALLHQQTGITAATKTIGTTEISDESDLRLELFTVKSALTSYQKFIHAFTRVTTTDQYALRVLADTPLGFWRLGDSVGSSTAYDASGNARNGTAVSVTFGVTALTTPGSLNKAADFSGSNAYVEIPYVAALAPTVAVSVELWIRFDTFPSSPTATQSLLSKTNLGGYNIEISNVTGMMQFLVRRNGVYGTAAFTRAGNVTTGVTYHIVGTFDGRYARIYLDGVLMATDDAGATYPIQYATNNSLIIAAEATTSTGIESLPTVDGVMDEVSVYGVAIAAAEVLARYKVGKNVLSYREDAFWDKTVLLLNMDGANASTTFTDAKGHTVTATGTAQVSTAQSKFGGASVNVGTSGSNYLRIAAHADFIMGTGDFTIEGWFRPVGTGDRFCYWHGVNTAGGLGMAVATNQVLFRASGTTDLTYTGAISSTLFTHVAITRRGNTRRIFVNGALVASDILVFNNSDSAVTDIGACPNVASDIYRYYGYIDDFRVTRACRYTKAFDVAVEAFPAQSAVAETVDPFWSDKTVLLLHMNGTNGSTTFTDVKSHAVTASGNAQISTAQSVFGGASAMFDGSGDFLSVLSSTDFDFAAGDFTIELRFRTAVTAHQALVDRRSVEGFTGTGDWYICSGFTSAGSVNVFLGAYSATTPRLTATTNYADSAWHQVAVVRAGNVLRLFVDGVKAAEATQSFTMATYTQDLTVGSRRLTGSFAYFNGHIDELRITKGAARYADSFAVPKLPYPDA